VAISQAPVIASHSSARHFTPGFERNPSDELIRALAAQGGVIQVNFGSTFLTATANAWSKTYNDARDAYLKEHSYEKNGPEEKAFEASYRAKSAFPYATLDDLLDHIDYIRDLVGVDHIGLGSDFDGVGDSLPVGVKSVADYPNIVAGLIARAVVTVAVFGALIAVSGFMRRTERQFAVELVKGLRRRAAKTPIEDGQSAAVARAGLPPAHRRCWRL
jgi:microsomal dipeptidase-like Zn-dependent dipeptidase